MNDTRSFKHSNDSSSTVNSLNNVNIQKSIKTTVYTPINKDKSIKQSGANSLQNNNGNQGSVNKNNNSINGNSEYSIFMKKKMNGKRKEAPLSKLCNFFFLIFYH